jgi:ParB-like chromosome segregation protein Spo0J
MTRTPPIHPFADAFPMMSRPELRELADDIAANGLREPIGVYQGQVLDGRNRLAACKLAKVTPMFVDLPDDIDPMAYVLSLNVARRHMSKGALAMVVVKLRADAQLETSYGQAAELAEASDVGRDRYTLAATVLRHAPDLVGAVISGARPLDSAIEIARKRRKDQESEAKQIERLAARHEDLADQVREERLTLKEATAAAKARDDEIARRQKVDTAFVDDHIGTLAFIKDDVEAIGEGYASTYVGDLAPGDVDVAIRFCTAFGRALKERGDSVAG